MAPDAATDNGSDRDWACTVGDGDAPQPGNDRIRLAEETVLIPGKVYSSDSTDEHGRVAIE